MAKLTAARRATKQISIVEIDSRDARRQSGIETYFNILVANMPDNISTFRIVFYRSPEYKDVRITQTDNELQILHPYGFPYHTLFDAVFAYVAPKLSKMPNLIIKSDCLGCEGLAYMIKSRIYCKTIGVLHCQPWGMQRPGDPFFNMDAVVCVADNGINHVNAWKCNRPVHVIYNGIDTPKIKNKKPKDDVFRFIFANGWSPNKGFVKIIPAIRRVAKKHKIEVMVLGGWTHEEETQFTETEGLPITRVGWVTDTAEIAKYYEMADAALFASHSEACSFAGIEAMAYNLPIVATNTNGLVEMFDNAALYADMTPEYDINIDQYEKHMLRVIEDKACRTKMAVRGYARFVSRYTSGQMVKKTIKLYEELIG